MEGKPSLGDGPEACVVNFPGGFSQSAFHDGWGRLLEGHPLALPHLGSKPDSPSGHPPPGPPERREDMTWQARMGTEGCSGRSPGSEDNTTWGLPGRELLCLLQQRGDGFCWGIILSPCRQQPNSMGTFCFLPLRLAIGASDYTWK